LASQKEALESELLEDNERFSSMQSDIKDLLACKRELESLLDQFKDKLEQKRQTMHYLNESIEYKDQELLKKDDALRRVSQSAEDLKRQLKTVENKLRQLTMIKLKDLQRKVKQQEECIDELKNKLLFLVEKEQMDLRSLSMKKNPIAQ
jgi:chromosome segregation ATPase